MSSQIKKRPEFIESNFPLGIMNYGDWYIRNSNEQNKEKEFISFISSIKFWDFNKISLWAFEEVLNYIDELLEKYSVSTNEEINKNILLPIIKFILLLLKNNKRNPHWNNEIHYDI